MKKILFAASECTPFIKTGGLADVAGSLPAALNTSSYEMRVIMPKYSAIPKEYSDRMEFLGSFEMPLSWRNAYCGLFKLTLGKLVYYFIDNEYYFKRENIYGEYDDGERFAFFSKAVCEAVLHMDFDPDVLHCNDWHTALCPVFLRENYMENPKTAKIKTVLSIHNLKFQGMFSEAVIGDILGLQGTDAERQLLEDRDTANYMMAGIRYADRVATVSPCYAREICTQYYGEGLDGVLREKGKITGILNGIDCSFYDPKTDPYIAVNYDEESFDKKSENKPALQKELGLAEDRGTPLFVMISRLTEQKGLDLLNYILPHIEERKMQLVVLGVGDRKYEQSLDWHAGRNMDRICYLPRFDEGLAHRLYAASDAFLMPSKFEPCGLSQMIAMRYGSVPIVRETGGLKDSVIPYNKYSGDGNGFSFANFNAHEFLGAIDRALDLYSDRRSSWKALARNAMKADFSWKNSAKEYRKLYKNL